MLIVQVCDFGSDGDAHYRLHDPSRQMGKLPGVTTVDCHHFSRHLPELMELADVLVLQFVNNWDLSSACLRRRAAGKVTVFEANDYFFDVQSWSPIAGRWHDRSNQELYLQLMKLADGVQTSTDELARRWRERGARQVAVFRNYLNDIPPLPPLPELSGRPLTIGWAGSPGHLGDWYFIAPMLQRWLEAHPDVRLAVMTDEPARTFIQLPAERYRFEPFGPLSSYLRFLEGIDIGLAPLLPTGYNRCRSDVKFLEYASRGVAGIYADLEPYQGVVIPGETGLVYRTPEQLLEHLDSLATNTALREKIRRNGYDYVLTRRINDHVNERVEWYRSLLPAPPEPVTLPAEISGEAIREGGYLQLPLREVEREFVAAIEKPASPQTNAALDRVLQKLPGYLTAWQTRGQLLNGQRDYQGALAALQQASALRPDDPHTLGEIARTAYLKNDLPRARELLEQALRINPQFLPAWQYLLRMLTWKRSPDGPALARRAEELFPACYPIALFGAGTYPPSQIPDVLCRLLDRHVPALRADERPAALAAFREAILLAVKQTQADETIIPMLRRAGELFPESVQLAGELGAALFRAGHTSEALEQQARALALLQQGAIIRSENEGNNAPPLAWRLAQHIRAAQITTDE